MLVAVSLTTAAGARARVHQRRLWSSTLAEKGVRRVSLSRAPADLATSRTFFPLTLCLTGGAWTKIVDEAMRLLPDPVDLEDLVGRRRLPGQDRKK